MLRFVPEAQQLTMHKRELKQAEASILFQVTSDEPPTESYVRSNSCQMPRQSPASAMQVPSDAGESSTGERRRRKRDGKPGPNDTHQQTYDRNTVDGNARAQFGNQYHIYYAPVNQSGPLGESSENRTPTFDVLAALSFDGMDIRRATIKSAHGNTCQWFFDSTAYKRWRDDRMLAEHHGFLWIKGKPGAGKSTLMKCAVKHAEHAFSDELGISFFFNAKGAPLERSIDGMYRSLLYQLLTQRPQLEKFFQNRIWTQQPWPLELLKDTLREVVSFLHSDRLTCHIDALDECDESEVRDMVNTFEELGDSVVTSKRPFRVCFASRHYPHITISRCVHVTLDELEGHHQDIENYVRKVLKIQSPELRDKLAREIRRRAHDVFLWVTLVVKKLNKESDQGNDEHFRTCLEKIPDGVHDLFENAVVERGKNDSKYLVPVLLWILLAVRPLTPLELYHAVRYTGKEHNVATPVKSNPSPSQIRAFLLNASKGMVEIVADDESDDDSDDESEDEPDDDSDDDPDDEPGHQPDHQPDHRSGRQSSQFRVQFVHETTREYLFKGGMRKLDGQIGSDLRGKGHDTLRQNCAKYLSMVAPDLPPAHISGQSMAAFENRRRQALEKHPLLRYVFENLVFHSERAQFHGISQIAFVKAFPLELMIKLSDLLEDVDEDSFLPTTSKAYIFASSGTPLLLKLELSKVCGNCGSRADLAATTTRCAGIRDVTRLHQGYLGSLLQAAAYNGDVESAKVLLSLGSNVNATAGPWHTALQTAAAAHATNMVRLLVAFGADVNVEGGRCGTALKAAVSSGSIDIVKFLLDNGADVNFKGEREHLFGTHYTALDAAVFSGNRDIADVLLVRGADVNAQGGPFDAALCATSFRRDIEMAKLLLRHGANVNVLSDLASCFNEAEIESLKRYHLIQQILHSPLAKRPLDLTLRRRPESRGTLTHMQPTR